MNKMRKLTFVQKPTTYLIPCIICYAMAFIVYLMRDILIPGSAQLIFSILCSSGAFLGMFTFLMKFDGKVIEYEDL